MNNHLQNSNSIVPTQTTVGHAFVVVIAIMTFLACLCVGISSCVYFTIQDWDKAIARDITVQIRQTDGIDMDSSVKIIIDTALATKGIQSAKQITTDQQKELLAPWFGNDIDASIMDFPAMIAIEVDIAQRPDIQNLIQQIKQKVPSASLDDHSSWKSKMKYSASILYLCCFFLFFLIMSAAAFTIAFATRGTLAGSRYIVDILSMLGATDGFIAGEFQREYFWFGLKGAAIGSICAIVLFAILGNSSAFYLSEDINFLLPISYIEIRWVGYGALLCMVLFVAFLTALISRYTTLAILNEEF